MEESNGGRASIATMPNHNPGQSHQAGNGGRASSIPGNSNKLKKGDDDRDPATVRIRLAQRRRDEKLSLEAQRLGMSVRALKALRKTEKVEKKRNLFD